jgi:hypothetical protein
VRKQPGVEAIDSYEIIELDDLPLRNINGRDSNNISIIDNDISIVDIDVGD